jgi:DNA-binding NarL/FixJ family response regulator
MVAYPQKRKTQDALAESLISRGAYGALESEFSLPIQGTPNMSTSTCCEPAPAAINWNDPRASRSALRPRLLLADDHDLLLEAFRRLLEPDFNIVGAVTDGETLVETALSLRPDAVLCDISMPRLSGLEAVRRLIGRLPGSRFIMLTMHSDPALAAEALHSGASAYVLKSSPSWELILAIRTALSGDRYFCHSLSPTETAVLPPEAEPIGDLTRVSPRGREVLKLLAGGRTMKETAARLGITTRTVAFHKYRIMHQLSLRSSAELIQFAVRRQLV